MIDNDGYITLSHSPLPSPVCPVLGLPEPLLNWRARFGDGQGKANQTASTMIFNHHGTHIDAPSHVFAGGHDIDFYRAEHFVFDRVGIAEVIHPETPISIDLSRDGFCGLSKDIDLLLIKTGMERWRSGEPERYVNLCPGFAPAAADTLKTSFPRLRAIGFDMFGVEHVASGRDKGWPVHKEFLREPALLPIEDMSLAGVFPDMALRIYAIPLAMPAEAMPVCVLAEKLRRQARNQGKRI